MIVPGAAVAEVCDKVRPGWARANGPATGVTEVLYLFATGPGLAAVLLTVAGFTFYRWWLFALAALVSAFLTFVAIAAALPDPTGLAGLARAEGCLGPPYLSIAVTAAITLLNVIRAVMALRLRETEHAKGAGPVGRYGQDDETGTGDAGQGHAASGGPEIHDGDG